MVTREDVETFLDRLGTDGATHAEVEPGLWIVRPSGPLDFDVVITHNPPVLLLRVKVMPLPADTAELAAISRRLLELNATDLLHGSYGIDADAIVLGHLDWDAKALGWHASWSLPLKPETGSWDINGVNFDAAFRNAVGGAAKRLRPES